MTYRAWNTKTVDRAALKELTAAIAQQNTEELEYQNMDEEWSEEKYRSVLAAQQNCLLYTSNNTLCAVRRRAGIKWGRCKKLEYRVTAVLVAAGSSTRMGFDKLGFDLGGETVLERSVRAFDECPEVDELVIVTGASSENAQRAAARCKKPVRLVKGGSTRAESARSGVVAAHGRLVAVHDAARPFVSQSVIADTIAAAARCGAAAPAVPVKDLSLIHI